MKNPVVLVTTTRTQKTEVIKTFRLPKGDYVFGDPGYLFGGKVLTNALWDEYCKICGDDGVGEITFMAPPGFMVWGSTAHGDDTYDFRCRGIQFNVPVDSGTLAFVNMDFAKLASPDDLANFATIPHTHCDLVVTYGLGNWYRGEGVGGSMICQTDKK